MESSPTEIKTSFLFRFQILKLAILSTLEQGAGEMDGKVWDWLHLVQRLSPPFFSPFIFFVPTSLIFALFFFSLSSLSHYFFTNINLDYHCLKSRVKAKYKTILEEKLLVM